MNELPNQMNQELLFGYLEEARSLDLDDISVDVQSGEQVNFSSLKDFTDYAEKNTFSSAKATWNFIYEDKSYSVQIDIAPTLFSEDRNQGLVNAVTECLIREVGYKIYFSKRPVT